MESLFQGMAQNSSATIRKIIASLGDGTYVVRGESYTYEPLYIRVDADLAPGSGYQLYMPASNNIWAILINKAYAYFYSGANTYASLVYGSFDSEALQFGNAATNLFKSSSDMNTSASFYTYVSTALAAGKVLMFVGASSPFTNGWPYVITGVNIDGGSNVTVSYLPVTSTNPSTTTYASFIAGMGSLLTVATPF
jgi:hypothetical protein